MHSHVSSMGVATCTRVPERCGFVLVCRTVPHSVRWSLIWLEIRSDPVLGESSTPGCAQQRAKLDTGVV